MNVYRPDLTAEIQINGFDENFPVTVSIDSDKVVELWDSESVNFILLSAKGARQLIAWLQQQIEDGKL